MADTLKTLAQRAVSSGYVMGINWATAGVSGSPAAALAGGNFKYVRQLLDIAPILVKLGDELVFSWSVDEASSHYTATLLASSKVRSGILGSKAGIYAATMSALDQLPLADAPVFQVEVWRAFITDIYSQALSGVLRHTSGIAIPVMSDQQLVEDANSVHAACMGLSWLDKMGMLDVLRDKSSEIPYPTEIECNAFKTCANPKLAAAGYAPVPMGPLGPLTCAAVNSPLTSSCVNHTKLLYHCGKSTSIAKVALPTAGLGSPVPVAVVAGVVVIVVAAIWIIASFDQVKQQLAAAKKIVDDQCASARASGDPEALSLCNKFQADLVGAAVAQAKTQSNIGDQFLKQVGTYVGVAAAVYLGVLMLPTIMQKLGEATSRRRYG